MKCFITSLFIVLLSVACYAGQLNFSGDLTQDPESGVTIMAQDGIVIISNDLDHYALVLPYEGDWGFSFETGSYLKGNSGRVNVSLNISESNAHVDDYLTALIAKLNSKSNPVRIKESKIIEYKNHKILKTVIDGEQINESFKGVNHINYYSFKLRGDSLYKLHISKVVKNNEMKKFEEEKFLQFASLGFMVDF
jgi:hypothetical protein